MLLRFWRWLLELLGLIPSPALFLEFTMSSFVWEWPVPTKRQRSLKEFVVRVRISDEFDWTEIMRIPHPETIGPWEDPSGGDWRAQGIVVDESGAESDPVEIIASVGFDDPSPAVSFTFNP